MKEDTAKEEPPFYYTSEAERAIRFVDTTGALGWFRARLYLIARALREPVFTSREVSESSRPPSRKARSVYNHFLTAPPLIPRKSVVVLCRGNDDKERRLAIRAAALGLYHKLTQQEKGEDGRPTLNGQD